MQNTNTSQSTSDPLFGVERNGINPIADTERHGNPFELFWVWFAANIAIFGVIYGAIVFASGLTLLQSVLVAVGSIAISFALVAVLSLAGVRTGVPMLTISRAPFGPIGNVLPALTSWFNLLGWVTVGVVLATYALLNVFASAGIPTTGVLGIALCLSLVLVLLVTLAILGHATAIWVLRLSTIVFGILSVVIGGFLLAPHVNWGKILSASPASWESLVATTSFLFVATGLTWTNTGADWARYLPPSSSVRAVILWTTIGAAIPLLGLLLLGFLLSSTQPNLAQAADPVAVIRSALPVWMAVPYLITVIGGLLSGSLISLYSSGLTLLALGVPWPRARTVWIDGLLILGGAVYILFFSDGFLGVFQSFLQLIAIGLLSWCAVFLVDMWKRGGVYDATELTSISHGGTYFYWGGVNWSAVLAWILGVVVGLLFTASPLFSGPWATGIFAGSSLGYLLGGLLAGALYWLALRFSFTRSGVPTKQEKGS